MSDCASGRVDCGVGRQFAIGLLWRGREEEGRFCSALAGATACLPGTAMQKVEY